MALIIKKVSVTVAAAQTDSVVVAAVTGKRLRVTAVFSLCGATATSLVFNSKPAGAGTAISPVFTPAVNAGIILPPNTAGWFDTASGEGLTVTTGAGTSTGLIVQYAEI